METALLKKFQDEEYKIYVYYNALSKEQKEIINKIDSVFLGEIVDLGDEFWKSGKIQSEYTTKTNLRKYILDGGTIYLTFEHNTTDRCSKYSAYTLKYNKMWRIRNIGSCWDDKNNYYKCSCYGMSRKFAVYKSIIDELYIENGYQNYELL